MTVIEVNDGRGWVDVTESVSELRHVVDGRGLERIEIELQGMDVSVGWRCRYSSGRSIRFEGIVHEVVAANVTIPSRPVDKENVREVTEVEVKGANLPAVIRYRRRVGEQREEIGFDLDTAPDIVKTDAGIDLKALVALLVLRIRSLEREVERLKGAVDGRGRAESAP